MQNNDAPMANVLHTVGVKVECRVSSCRRSTSPKSQSLILPSWVSRMFSGRRSRYKIPWWLKELQSIVPVGPSAFCGTHSAKPDCTPRNMLQYVTPSQEEFLVSLAEAQRRPKGGAGASSGGPAQKLRRALTQTSSQKISQQCKHYQESCQILPNFHSEHIQQTTRGHCAYQRHGFFSNCTRPAV